MQEVGCITLQAEQTCRPGHLEKRVRIATQAALDSTEDVLDTVIHEQGDRTIRTFEGEFAGNRVPEQDKVRSIKSQQASTSREREKRIKGIQEQAYSNTETHDAAAYRVLNGFGEDDLSIMPPMATPDSVGPSASLRFGPFYLLLRDRRAGSTVAHPESEADHRSPDPVWPP